MTDTIWYKILKHFDSFGIGIVRLKRGLQKDLEIGAKNFRKLDFCPWKSQAGLRLIAAINGSWKSHWLIGP